MLIVNVKLIFLFITRKVEKRGPRNGLGYHRSKPSDLDRQSV